MKQTFQKMNGHFIASAFLVMVLASTAFYSCKKETDKNNSPAYHIAESEKITIPSAVDLPANLPAGYTRVATFYAEGVQKYKSQLVPNSNPVEYEWVFTAPEADLFDASNKKIGIHGAGPYWKLLNNTDSIFGQQYNPPRYAFSPDPKSIDWLLLMPKTGKTPTGIFAGVNHIQRIATSGGKKPSAPPGGPGQYADIKYTAVYRFTKSN
jgi:hypothetical protein